MRKGSNSIQSISNRISHGNNAFDRDNDRDRGLGKFIWKISTFPKSTSMILPLTDFESLQRRQTRWQDCRTRTKYQFINFPVKTSLLHRLNSLKLFKSPKITKKNPGFGWTYKKLHHLNHSLSKITQMAHLRWVIKLMLSANQIAI